MNETSCYKINGRIFFKHKDVPCKRRVMKTLGVKKNTQAFLSKRHRQQNNEILIRHSPGIGECFLFLSIQLTEKNKKNLLRGL